MHLPSVLKSALGLLVTTSQAWAFFRLPCAAPIVIQRADPIVNPGQLIVFKVSGHVHTIVGGNGFGFQMDFAATQRSTCSSCLVKEDLSNYWVPILYFKGPDGKFTEVTQTGGETSNNWHYATTNLSGRQRTDPRDQDYPHMVAFPNEFRMLAGDPFLRSYNASSLAQQAITWACLGTSTPESGGMPNIKCPDGLRAQVFFPSCWDGKNVDTPDHKSHVAYPDGVTVGSCPASHPKRLISIFYEIIFNTPNFQWSGDHHPFVLAQGDPTGYGFHGDFVNGWKEGVLQKAIDDCNIESDVIEECKHFSFITNQVAQSCRVPASIDEQTSGTLDKLPGCNPVQPGPDPAKPQSGCGAPTTIGKPHFPFTDFTGSKHFAYTGCALDTPGQARTLQGASLERGDMTIDSCIDFCVQQGFDLAGVEYGKQCFCGHPGDVANDRKPVPGLLRDCSQPCSGNPSQVCGNFGLLSLYQKCGSSGCQNVQLTFLNGSAPGH
ncbi:hypothetical protein HYALB_00011278 [Hymenoscyphus albidus]|uniref:WSC domain-containing protein n=1 Tax=Hymenoscyphus albidus TaxID=595503 RepID=A0A9N9LXD4_9HELO|nr:hypothetical protein HYALB_00011278 [Hymenoscyphus albidus]